MGNISNGSLVHPVAGQCIRHSVELAMRRLSGPKADYISMQTKIPAQFWTELKAQKLIEQNRAGTSLSTSVRLVLPSNFSIRKEQSYE
jgi:hypothetical protein